MDKSVWDAVNIEQNFHVLLAKFRKNILVLNRIKQEITALHEIWLNLTKFYNSKWY
jgi:hypothetical protein